MERKDISTKGWADYELLDSGDNKKLERFGSLTIVRPETQAIWRPAHPELWSQAQTEFFFNKDKGSWSGAPAPEPWTISWDKQLTCSLKLTNFKHTGIFPEQEPNWRWVAQHVDALTKENEQPKVLNLFGYTGAASIVAAAHGAIVTHADASKQSNTWAKENATLSGIAEGGIRYITDDALKFVEREARRGAMYDGIILDPPAFGRGPDGEVWRIEEHIVPLLDAIKKIFSNKPGAFFLLNGYAAGYAPQSLMQSVESAFGAIKNGEFGELHIEESRSERTVPSGIYVRFVK